MTSSELIVNEFKRRVFTESYSRIFKCLSMISDEELWFTPNKNTPSIGSLVLHLCGNGKQWIVCGLGSAPDHRQREKEFEKHLNIKKSELVFVMENLKIQITEVLHTIKDEDLHQPKNIQGLEENVFSVLVHVLEHFSYHTGQITTLTKIITNKQTGYYDQLGL
ncbi:DinB family protein [Lishizhenia sp.]|uniref:DinB family protein n=1 Tax=Lishizhenia sp. TaxID=2497594 RepID=UPI00299D234A|nr:DinB family protein [Lishizhenia sp.]MDX1447121.1 DinB family protein [Lishizhenia sp.]